MIRRISLFALLTVLLMLLAACVPIQPMEGAGAAAGDMATAMPTQEAMAEATAMPAEEMTGEATEEAMGEATAMPAEEATEEAMGEATAMPMEEGTPMPVEPDGGTGATGGATVMASGNDQLGAFVVDAAGMTLYMFDKDTPGVSNCYDDCAVKWPPLLVAEGEQPTAGEGVTGALGVTERTDGTYQVTFNDLPLYYWWEDLQPGDTLGQAVGDVWWVMAPDGTIIR